MTEKSFGNVSVRLNHEAHEGKLHLPGDASEQQTEEAWAFLDEQGFEELDAEESGDPIELDDEDRAIVPLVKICGEHEWV